MYTYIEGHCAKIMGCCTSNVPTVKVAAAAANGQKFRFKMELPRKSYNFGILLPKLFWPTVRKNCSSDREKVLKFEAEGQEFAKILRSLKQFVQKVQWKVKTIFVKECFFNFDIILLKVSAGNLWQQHARKITILSQKMIYYKAIALDF